MINTITSLIIHSLIIFSTTHAESNEAGKVLKTGYQIGDATDFNFHAHGFEIRRVSICPKIGHSMLVVDGLLKAFENTVDDDAACGKIFYFLDDKDERIFGFGTLYYYQKISKDDYRRYRRWLAELLALEGGDPKGTKFIEYGPATNEDGFNRGKILSKLYGSEDKRQWGIYDIGIRDVEGGSAVNFTVTPFLSQDKYLKELNSTEKEVLGTGREILEHWRIENERLVADEWEPRPENR